MAHSQLVRNYKVFIDKVIKPYELSRTLSNGDLIGKCYDDQEDGLTRDEIDSYIKNNHIEPIEIFE